MFEINDKSRLCDLKSMLENRDFIECKIVSDSMLPLIQPNEIIKIKGPPGPAKLKRFDVIVFHFDQKFICHFIWSRSALHKGHFITRSLKRPTENDIPFKYEQILGIAPNLRLSVLQKLRIVFLTLRSELLGSR